MEGRDLVFVAGGIGLAALLMVLIFVLVIFTFAQFLLSEVLTSKEDELTELNRRIEELTQVLGLEQEKNRQLGDQVGELSDLITRVTEEKFELSGQAEDLERQLAFERETVQRQLLTLASLQQDIDALRRLREQLEAQVGALAGSLQASGDYGRSLRDRSRALEARLAEQE